MKLYKVVVTEEAKRQMKKCLAYIRYNLNNEQAYESLKSDYQDTVLELSKSVGIIAEDTDENLRKREIKRIHFLRHRYVMLYTIEDDTAYIVEIHHELEDYRNS